jgi:hypothetical protein
MDRFVLVLEVFSIIQNDKVSSILDLEVDQNHVIEEIDNSVAGSPSP